MGESESGWKTVRRRTPAQKTPSGAAGIRFDPAVTSFYVSNLPGDAKKGDIWKDCAGLGNLVDIYMVGRSDSSGFFFAFVRFLDVVNPDSIVEGLNKINIRGRLLKANCAKNPPPLPSKPRAPPVRHIPRFHSNPRDSRSFMDVLGDKSNKNVRTNSNQHTPVISLSVIPEIQKWANSDLFVGVAKNFDTLCNFSVLISMEGFDISEVKYIVGMNIAVKFKSKRAGEVFKANKNLWLKWFSSVEPFDKCLNSRDRIAWVKVVGIPPLAWDDTNFATVLEKYGKVVVFPSSFWNSSDVSAGKLCILTEFRKKLNEDIEVQFNGTRCKVGIVEIEDDWIPFRPFTVGNETESDDGDDEEEADNDEELEDGEIGQDEIPAVVLETPAVVLDTAMEVASCPVHAWKKSSPRAPETRGKNQPPIVQNNGTGVNLSPTTHVAFNAGGRSGMSFGPIGSLGPLGSCGCEKTGPRETPWFNGNPNFQSGESNATRTTRVKKKNKNSKPVSSNCLPGNKPPTLLDLNRSFGATSDGGSSSSPTQSMNSATREIDQVVEIGKMVGFQINRENPSLTGATNGGGAKQCTL